MSKCKKKPKSFLEFSFIDEIDSYLYHIAYQRFNKTAELHLTKRELLVYSREFGNHQINFTIIIKESFQSLPDTRVCQYSPAKSLFFRFFKNVWNLKRFGLM